MTVFIAYGWPEGKLHGTLFRKALISANYQIAQTAEEADIIIAHSAGCYMIPSDVKAKLILLIGLPNSPKSLIKCTFYKIKLEQKNMQWFQKTLYHIFYAISQPIKLLSVYKSFKRKYVPVFTENKVLLIRNAQDTYMEKGLAESLAMRRGWQYKI